MLDNRGTNVNLRRLLLHHEQALLTQLDARALFDHPTSYVSASSSAT